MNIIVKETGKLYYHQDENNGEPAIFELKDKDHIHLDSGFLVVMGSSDTVRFIIPQNKFIKVIT